MGITNNKDAPVYRGFLALFPNAMREIAGVMLKNQEKYVPDRQPHDPIVWRREVSFNHEDSLARHLLEAGKIDPEDGQRHTAKVATRALMLLEVELEQRAAAGEPEVRAAGTDGQVYDLAKSRWIDCDDEGDK